MLLFADKALPEPEGDAPDWTYEELIDAFVVNYSLDWIERKRKPIERGMISPRSRQLIVELRAAPSEPAPTNLNFWTFAELHEYRCWFLDMDGLEEIDLAQCQELITNPNFTETDAFSQWKFSFEYGYRVMVSALAQKMGGFVMTRCPIVRDGDGKLTTSDGVTLAMS